VVRAQRLCKSFHKTPILTDLTFHLEAGDCLALLGANGSGKSLLLKLIATLVKPTSGTLEIAGYDALSEVEAIRPLIGYVPEAFEGYAELSVQEYLEFFAGAYRLKRERRSATIQDVLELMELSNWRQRKIGTLSSGQKQRLGLARTFLHDPLIWLLDNPLSALDPHGQAEMSALLQELSAMGKTIILATNRFSDVTSTFNRVSVLSEGRLAFFGGAEEISRFFKGMYRLEIRVIGGAEIAQGLLKERSDLELLEATDGQIVIETQMQETAVSHLLKSLIDAGVQIVGVHKFEDRWVDLFSELTATRSNGGQIK
jgi:ABC-2 type transport system ATP-binding protein